MELLIRSRSRKIKKNIKRDHYWYDVVNKKMLHGHGGKMEFIYSAEQKRCIPHITDEEIYVTENDYPYLLKWIDDNKRKFNITVSEVSKGYFLSLNVSARNLEDIIEDLYKNKISFDFDEVEYRRELNGYS